jgi:hypothetical protein
MFRTTGWPLIAQDREINETVHTTIPLMITTVMQKSGRKGGHNTGSTQTDCIHIHTEEPSTLRCGGWDVEDEMWRMRCGGWDVEDEMWRMRCGGW